MIDRQDDWVRLLDEEDAAERNVHELSEELSEYEEETDEWYQVHTELCAAENELHYIQCCKEDFDG